PQQLANLKRYNRYRTALQYRTGFREEAVLLGKTLINMPVLMKYDSMPSNADLRLVLGRDIINTGLAKEGTTSINSKV
ncbi:MAG: hypothetical protein ACT4OH_06650, partial [Methylophilaceae bacterium]